MYWPDAASRHNVRHMSQRVVLAPGEVLFTQGDEGQDAYIIVSGAVHIKAVRRGVDALVNVLGPGEMLGELALIDGGPRTATAIAAERTELAQVTNAQIAERMSRADPVLSLLLTQAMRHFRREIQDPVHERPASVVAIERMRLEGELAGAVERRELELWYQPIVDLDACTVAGFEALVRWRHPDRGLVSPADFIPLAEASGLIVPIGEWVIDEGARALCELDDMPGEPRFMSVNVSGRQLDSPGLLETVRRAVRTVGAPNRLHLEMTEGVLIQSPAARDAVRACKELGAGLFLDDFGTGYSSLAYLNQLPFDALKIDHSFARKMEEMGDGHKLILAIVGLAATLGRAVVMEGIETAGQRDAYRAMGGRLCQGYLFARPAPLAAARELLTSSHRLPWG